MKQKTLLSILFLFMIVPVIAQKQIKGFAITASQKGNSGWKEVRIVDMTTGEELQSIYKNDQTIELLNARTGKPVVKKEPDKANPTYAATVTTTDANGNIRTVRKAVRVNTSTDLPFATNSAACAYDKKHERLYYTPMGINELRYIDLKSKTPRIYYFENEAFGALSGPRDIANQVTRMVIGADGNGYALTNNANHLIRFTTGKKPTITNLGAINDDASNGDNSIHHQKAYGGDMVAHKNGNLYLLTANRRIFRIDIEKRIATFVGEIRGLPKGFTTNGAMVNEGMNIIVCSSNSTQGYFQFDLDKLEAEKITGSSPVYNASDLANSNLLTNKKKKKEPVKYDELNPVQNEVTVQQKQKPTADQLVPGHSFSIYPNPATTRNIKLAFKNQPAGKYQVQFLDITGRLISQQEITIQNTVQVQDISIPTLVTAGNYLVKVLNEKNKLVSSEKLVVQ